MTNEKKELSLKNDFSDTYEVIETINQILTNITNYSEDLDERTPSIFDNSNKNENENLNYSISTSTNSEISEKSQNSQTNFNNFDLDLENFILKFAKKFKFNDNILILALMNIDKILENDFIITENNVKNLFYISMVEVQKFYEDEPFKNSDYAYMGGISTNVLCQMEIEFLDLIDYKLFVSDNHYFNYKKDLYLYYKEKVE